MRELAKSAARRLDYDVTATRAGQAKILELQEAP
jgi:hypothetical protein